MSEAIHEALVMPLAERTERWAAMMAVLERDSLTAWRERLVARLAAQRQ